MELFVTGGTGILGQKLVFSLSNSTDIEKIYLLVRDTNIATNLFKRLPNVNIDKILFLKGELTQELCGLSETDALSLRKVNKCFHLAASVHLGHGDKVKQMVTEVNINGTKNILDFLKSNTQIKEVVYVSNAYSCGVTSEIVGDVLQNKPYHFRNPYEESKWDAEHLLKNELKDTKIKFAVIRPGILLSSDLGNMRLSNHTIYLFSNILQKFTKLDQKKIRLIGNPDAKLNFVFIEDLVKYLANLDIKNQSVNFVNAVSIRIDELLKTISDGLSVPDLFNFEKGKIHEISAVESQINSLLKPFQPYFLEKWPVWDSSTLIKDVVGMNFQLKGKNEVRHNIKFYCEMMKKNE